MIAIFFSAWQLGKETLALIADGERMCLKEAKFSLRGTSEIEDICTHVFEQLKAQTYAQIFSSS